MKFKIFQGVLVFIMLLQFETVVHAQCHFIIHNNHSSCTHDVDIYYTEFSGGSTSVYPATVNPSPPHTDVYIPICYEVVGVIVFDAGGGFDAEVGPYFQLGGPPYTATVGGCMSTNYPATYISSSELHIDP